MSRYILAAIATAVVPLLCLILTIELGGLDLVITAFGGGLP